MGTQSEQQSSQAAMYANIGYQTASALQIRLETQEILDKVRILGGSAIITADHGNFEKMIDGGPDNPHTAHTIGDVPLIVFDDRYKKKKLRNNGRLADVAPTLLEIMGLPQPKEMTGKSLLTK